MLPSIHHATCTIDQNRICDDQKYISSFIVIVIKDQKIRSMPTQNDTSFPFVSNRPKDFPYPPPSGNILPNPRNISIIGISFVPALFLSLSSLAFSLDALSARTLSACLPAASTRCSNLCMLSANWSTSNSRDCWMLRIRDSVRARTPSMGSSSDSR